MYTGEIKNRNKKVLIVYASCSGNAELVAQSVCDGISCKNFKTEIKRAEITSANEILKFNSTILVCSTWNVGLLNDYMIKFHQEMKTMDLSNLIIDVIGLGDSKNYDIFCGAADILEQTVKDAGGQQLRSTLRIDGQVFGRLNEFKQWGQEYALALDSI